MDSPQNKSSVSEILRNRDFSKMFIGGAISDIGSYFTFIAMMFLALEITEPLGEELSTQKVSLIIVVMAIPSIVLGPFAGAIVDRFDRKKMMYSMDIIGALASAGLVYVALFSQNINHIYAFAIFSSVVRLFFYPARGASIPKVINNPQDLVSANGFIQIFAQASRVIGPAIAGFVINWLGLASAFIIDGISFFISALLIFSIKTDLRPEVQGIMSVKQVMVDMKYGFEIVIKDRTLMFIVSFFSLIILVVGAIDPLFTPYLNFEFGMGEKEFGTIMSVSAISGLLASLIITARGDIKNKLPFIVSAAFIIGSSLIILGLAPFLPLPMLWLYVGMAVVGVINVIFSIPLSALLQTIVPSKDLGKVNGLMGMAISMFQMVGAGIAAVIAGYITISVIYSGIGIITMIIGVFFLVYMVQTKLNQETIAREHKIISQSGYYEQKLG
ncbi:MAG: MFS transporter [Candidatus Heimdallarchaeota archaeon]|nr:MFS transporter [Candidatus Heimdallarchaeota archaeon]